LGRLFTGQDYDRLPLRESRSFDGARLRHYGPCGKDRGTRGRVKISATGPALP